MKKIVNDAMNMRQTDKNRGKGRLVAVLAVLVVSGAALSGCSKAAWNGSSESAVETKATEESQVAVVETGSVTGGNTDTMLETGGDLFFKYRNDLWRLDKNNDQMQKVRIFTGEQRNGTFWIYNNCLYFDMSETTDYQAGGNALYKKDLATGEEVKLTDLEFVPTGIYASEGFLYAKGFNQLKIYALNEDGTIGKDAPLEDTIYGKLPEGCMELYQDILPYLAERVGYMPLMNGENLIIADKDGKSVRSVPEITNMSSVIFDKDAFYAILQKEEGKYTCVRYDVNTLESSVLFETAAYPTLLQCRDGVLYYLESGSFSIPGADSSCFRVDVKTGEKTLAASMTEDPGTSGFYSYSGSFYATGNAVYCQTISDYSVYLEKTSLQGENDRTMLNTPLYQSPIGELGTVTAKENRIPCECGEKTAVEVYVEQLVINGSSEAAARMNRVLEEDAAKQFESSAGGAMIPDEGWVHDENFTASTLTYRISEPSYLSDSYVCIRMEGYEYPGGAAHGMPYRNEFIFDRQTGKQLMLADLINNSEDEVKAIVSRHFAELARQTGFAFEDPDTLEKTVAEGVTMDSPFYITKEGIVFYYCPYDISPYAAGFPEITVPFSELNMKVEL